MATRALAVLLRIRIRTADPNRDVDIQDSTRVLVGEGLTLRCALI